MSHQDHYKVHIITLGKGLGESEWGQERMLATGMPGVFISLNNAVKVFTQDSMKYDSFDALALHALAGTVDTHMKVLQTHPSSFLAETSVLNSVLTKAATLVSGFVKRGLDVREKEHMAWLGWLMETVPQITSALNRTTTCNLQGCEGHLAKLEGTSQCRLSKDAPVNCVLDAVFLETVNQKTFRSRMPK